MKKYQVKAFVKENSVRKNEKIFALQPTRTATFDDIVNEMAQQNSGISRELLRAASQLFLDTLTTALLNGNVVNLPTFRASLSFRGAVEREEWDRERNTVVAQFVQGKALKELLNKDIDVEVVGEQPRKIRIAGVHDHTTGQDNGSVTPGGIIAVKGRFIAIAGDAEKDGVGITFTDFDDRLICRLDPQRIVINQPSTLTFQLPDSLPVGVCQLNVITRCTDGSRMLLAPRIATYGINVHSRRVQTI
jgi:nucleoid DNA-binding protein